MENKNKNKNKNRYISLLNKIELNNIQPNHKTIILSSLIDENNIEFLWKSLTFENKKKIFKNLNSTPLNLCLNNIKHYFNLENNNYNQSGYLNNNFITNSPFYENKNEFNKLEDNLDFSTNRLSNDKIKVIDNNLLIRLPNSSSLTYTPVPCNSDKDDESNSENDESNSENDESNSENDESNSENDESNSENDESGTKKKYSVGIK